MLLVASLSVEGRFAFGYLRRYVVLLDDGQIRASRQRHREAILRPEGAIRDREAVSEASLRPSRTPARFPGAPPVGAGDRRAPVVEQALPAGGSCCRREPEPQGANKAGPLDRWDVADDALMTEALSYRPPAPGKPRLRIPATPGRPFEKALQGGRLFFARGSSPSFVSLPPTT